MLSPRKQLVTVDILGGWCDVSAVSDCGHCVDHIVGDGSEAQP